MTDPNFTEVTHPKEADFSTSGAVKLTLLAWLAMVGFDFFLHGGLLAGLYEQPSPFLLDPQQAFVLIPVGYLSFLLLAILLVWLIPRLGIRGFRDGGVFGMLLGALIWGSFILGLISISSVPLSLAAGWFLGQTIELGLGGAMVGLGLETRTYRLLFLAVILLVLGAFVLSIILQNI
jgi:hypothetical protein